MQIIQPAVVVNVVGVRIAAINVDFVFPFR